MILPSNPLPFQKLATEAQNQGVKKLFRIKNEDNGVVLVSLMLTVNIFSDML